MTLKRTYFISINIINVYLSTPISELAPAIPRLYYYVISCAPVCKTALLSVFISAKKSRGCPPAKVTHPRAADNPRMARAGNDARGGPNLSRNAAAGREPGRAAARPPQPWLSLLGGPRSRGQKASERAARQRRRQGGSAEQEPAEGPRRGRATPEARASERPSAAALWSVRFSDYIYSRAGTAGPFAVGASRCEQTRSPTQPQQQPNRRSSLLYQGDGSGSLARAAADFASVAPRTALRVRRVLGTHTVEARAPAGPNLARPASTVAAPVGGGRVAETRARADSGVRPRTSKGYRRLRPADSRGGLINTSLAVSAAVALSTRAGFGNVYDARPCGRAPLRSREDPPAARGAVPLEYIRVQP